MKKYKNIALSGGGIKVLAQYGVLKSLIDNNNIVLDEVTGVSGSSGGALLGLFIALKYSIDEINNILTTTNFGEIVYFDVSVLSKKMGMNNGKKLHDFIENIIIKKCNNRHINFNELYELTGIHYIITGSCVDTSNIIYYDYKNTPKFKVSTAVRISTCLPLIFTPVLIDGYKYIDGGFINNYPINVFENDLDNTIGILINIKSKNQKSDTLFDYLSAIFNMFFYNYYSSCANKYEENTIVIDDIPDGLSMITFSLNQDTISNLIDIGYKIGSNFLIK